MASPPEILTAGQKQEIVDKGMHKLGAAFGKALDRNSDGNFDAQDVQKMPQYRGTIKAINQAVASDNYTPKQKAENQQQIDTHINGEVKDLLTGSTEEVNAVLEKSFREAGITQKVDAQLKKAGISDAAIREEAERITKGVNFDQATRAFQDGIRSAIPGEIRTDIKVDELAPSMNKTPDQSKKGPGDLSGLVNPNDFPTFAMAKSDKISDKAGERLGATAKVIERNGGVGVV